MRAITDPMELLIAEALEAAGVEYEYERLGLDFYLPALDLFIEVKRFHSPRIAGQMERAENVIAVQGLTAVQTMSALIRRGDLSSYSKKNV